MNVSGVRSRSWSKKAEARVVWKTLEKAGRRSSARGASRDHDDDVLDPRRSFRHHWYRVGGIRREIDASTRSGTP